MDRSSGICPLFFSVDVDKIDIEQKIAKKEKDLGKKVLLVATGALFCPTLLYQKENINSICHAVSLEVV